MDINQLLGTQFPFLSKSILKTRISWSIRLRWLAIVGFLTASSVVNNALNLALPIYKIGYVLLALTFFNISYFIIHKYIKKFTLFYELLFLSLHILIDLIFLTLLIHLSGGVENPVYLFYIFHIVLGSIVLPRWYPYIIATFVVFLFSGLVFFEYSGLIPHYCIFNTNVHSNLHLSVLIVLLLAITLYITTYICTTFMRIFRSIKRELDGMNQKLIEADMQKTQFYRFTSHELKSPIIAIKSSVDGIISAYGSRIEERPLKVLNRVSLRAAQMLNILKELLELSQNRNGREKTSKDTIHLNTMLAEIIEGESSNAEQMGIEISYKKDETIPTILGNENDFHKVFGNLISNAVRYNKPNGRVNVTTELNTNGKIEINISDTGIGIAEKDVTQIFNEFYRSENAKQSVSFGTGLGLSIVKQIVENYQGSIYVQSRLNKGTTFTIWLPVKE